MNKIYEVTAWKDGFWNSFKKPQVIFVWAASASEALQVALRVQAMPVDTAQQISVGPAIKQNPADYNEAVTEIVNLPMADVEIAWAKNNAPSYWRAWRPTYVRL